MAILKYKNAEGNFVPLNNYLVQPITPVQTTGSSPTDIMSQAAVTDAINQGLDTKVTKIEGKGLSTNDYTTSEKDKLAAIEVGANKYILPAATTSTLGGIIVGDRLSIDSTGKLVATYTYTLPTASSTVLGGVKTGSNITNTSGTISLTKANVTAALGVDPTTTYVKKAGDSMTGDLTSTAKVQANILKSTVATGTAPVQVTSTTVCTNLNADMVDGYNSTDFVRNLGTSNNETIIYSSKRSDNTAVREIIDTGHALKINSYSSVSDKNFNKNLKLRVNDSIVVTQDSLHDDDWYGVSWSETSSNPDCTRIGNMDMHRTLPIQSMMRSCAITNYKSPWGSGSIRYLNNEYKVQGGFYSDNTENPFNNNTLNIMVEIPEFWYIDEYVDSSKTHNLKICQHAKPGWNHHKKAYVGAYEGVVYDNIYISNSSGGNKPTVNVTRDSIRTKARANGPTGQSKWNIYTYEEHRAICHLFLVEYATRNSQKAINTSLTAEGFRQGGLGSGCTTGAVTINGATAYPFIPVGSSNSLKHGSGEVTVTVQQTDASGNNTTAVTRKCNRYRGIENPFGHIWKHTDDVISMYESTYRYWYKCDNPANFSNNKNNHYITICSSGVVTGYKTQIIATPNCDFFARACTNGSETTYWCDYNWDNTDTAEHCLLIGGHSGNSGQAGLFALHSNLGVGYSDATIGSRLTYLPWAE